MERKRNTAGTARAIDALLEGLNPAQRSAATYGIDAAPSTFQAGSGECRRLAVSIGDLLPTDAADFRPDLECLGPRSSMLNVIAAEVEEVIDLIVG